jgi:predicted AlkP superfamily pyrophosphatase or phosphodiesterase
MLDAATLEYARTMVTSLGMGKDDAPDFLNVSLSQTDRVGHAYGPMSREQLDNLLRLDRELGEFFTFLDRTVGTNQWTVVLSADHGSLLTPETLPQPGESAAGRRGTADEKAQLKTIRDEAAKAPIDAASAMRTAAALRQLPFVAEAYTEAQLLGTTPADSFTVLERRSFYPGRAAADFSPYGVEVRFVEGWLSSVRGTSHGTPYWYDRHVPVLFMGPGIAPGQDTTRAATVDVAPTLARVLRVTVPTAVDGRPLSAVTNH